MAEKGYLGTTGTSNDATNTYPEAEASIIMKVIAACSGFEGVAPGYLSELACAAQGANTVRVSPGGGVIDGVPYSSSANVDVNIPSAVGGGNTRIDRIVVRTIWATHLTRITRIAGTDAASPAAPAMTQTTGNTYDISLCTVLVNTGGTVTVTDARKWAIADNSIGIAAIGTMVPGLLGRQGGSATAWGTVGTANYTSGLNVRIQTGVAATGEMGDVTVTFPVAFSNTCIVLLTPNSGPASANHNQARLDDSSNTGFTATAMLDGTGVEGAWINWLAIGPE